MHANLKTAILGFSLLTVLQCAPAQTREDFLNAPGRVEWDAGGLYDGRFDDGTPFQLQLAYPRPATVPDRAAAVWNAYWYPRHFTGERIVLSAQEAKGGTIELQQWKPVGIRVETVSVKLSPDRLGGSGSSTLAQSGKERKFVLHRVLLYREVAVVRPAPPAPPGVPGNPAPFVFSALFPVLADPGANAWMRKTLATCTDETECSNSVIVDWASPSLVSLDATTYGYTYPAAHGNGVSSMRHYRLQDGKMIPVGLDAFLDPGPACRKKASDAIVARLRAQNMDDAKYGALSERYDPKFLALPDGLEVHFDPYEVGNYAQGSPSVFLPRAELGQCLGNLPAVD